MPRRRAPACCCHPSWWSHRRHRSSSSRSWWCRSWCSRNHCHRSSCRPELLVAARVGVAAGVVARLVLRGFDLGLQAGGGLGGPARFFLCDELAELGFGVDPRLLVLAGELLGLLLGVDERLGERFGFGDLVFEHLTVVFELADEGVEFVGADVAGAERHTGELVTLEHVVDVARVFEQRTRTAWFRNRRTNARPCRRGRRAARRARLP